MVMQVIIANCYNGAMMISEKAFQAQVLQLATMYGWMAHHTYDSRRSQPGYPDLALCRQGEYLLVELKTDKGRLRPAQRQWLDALRSAGIEVWVWRPADWDTIVERLTRHALVRR